MLTIAWDVDDVLNDLMGCWLTRNWLPEHSGCQLSFAQITQNPPQHLLNASQEEYQSSLDQFRLSGAYEKMLPDPQVLAWFNQHGDKCRHIVLTAVPAKASHISASWVMRHFGKWIRSFNYVPSPRAGDNLPDYGRTKADYLKWLGKVDVFVEDTEANLAGIEKMGIRALLIAKPWNKSKLKIKEVLFQLEPRL